MKSFAIQKVGRVSRESVLKGTGKDWDQWIRLLDRAGGRQWNHREIVAFLKTRHRLSPWWQQGVAQGYEVHTGQRVEGRTLKGDYSITATKTLPISARTAWRLLCSEDGLRSWLQPLSQFSLRKGEAFETETGAFGEVRTVHPGARARLAWQESDGEKPSVVLVSVVSREPQKCILVIQHEKLVDERSREPLREQWKEALTRLASLARRK